MQSYRVILNCIRKTANPPTTHRAHIKEMTFHQKQPGEQGMVLVKAWKSTTSNIALYSFAKLSLQIKGEIRAFQYKYKLRRFMTTKPELIENY